MKHSRVSIRPRYRVGLSAIALLVFALDSRAADQAGLSLTFKQNAVTVGGATAGHQVVAFGIGIGKHGRAPLLTRYVRALTDDDGDGAVTFAVRNLPSRSVWVAVDLESGEHAVATPTGETPAALDFPADAWRGGRADVDVAGAWLEVLVVRRKVGAWTLRTADGGSNDADGASNGVLKVRLDRMERLTGEEKGPSFTIPKDLIVVIDPHTLRYFGGESK